MSEQRKTLALGATGGEGSRMNSDLHDSAFDALRKTLIARMRNGQCHHGALVQASKDMGFTAAQARAAIGSLVDSGAASYVAENTSVLVLPAANRGDA